MINDRRSRRDTGFATIEWLVAATFSLLFLITLLDLITVQYARGVIRAAADEGARAGARVVNNQVASCQARENDVVTGLGKMAKNIQTNCAVVNGQLQATTSATFIGWFPWVPSDNAVATAVSHAENAPVLQ